MEEIFAMLSVEFIVLGVMVLVAQFMINRYETKRIREREEEREREQIEMKKELLMFTVLVIVQISNSSSSNQRVFPKEPKLIELIEDEEIVIEN